MATADSSARGYDAVLAALVTHGHRLLPKSDSHRRAAIRTTCPAHVDRKPSLVVTRGDDGSALVHCFAGCKLTTVLTALGLQQSDLFVSSPSPALRAKRRVVAEYEYRALDGRLTGTKVRFDPKAFCWRRGTHDEPSVYRLPDLIDVRRVFLTEGEKAADRLWAMGLPATCGPQGASQWKVDWSHDLWAAGCRELIVFADNDKPGKVHATRVAAVTVAVDATDPVTVTLVDLPGLAAKADLCDWLDDGHDRDALLSVVATTPAWRPGLADEQRLARRRQQTADRVRAFRARKRLEALTYGALQQA